MPQQRKVLSGKIRLLKCCVHVFSSSEYRGVRDPNKRKNLNELLFQRSQDSCDCSSQTCLSILTYRCNTSHEIHETPCRTVDKQSSYHLNQGCLNLCLLSFKPLSFSQSEYKCKRLLNFNFYVSSLNFDNFIPPYFVKLREWEKIEAPTMSSEFFSPSR